MKKYLTIKNMFFIASYIVVITVFIYRVIRGVDLTDESFYASLAYRMSNGNMLFRDMWEQCSTSAVFPAMLLRLYTSIMGGNNGLILFLRLSFFVCNLCLFPVIFCAMRNYLEDKLAFLISSVFLLYTPFHIYNFSYNNQADLLFIVMVSLLLIAIKRDDFRIYLISGIVCAILAFIYPTLIMICPIMVLLVFVSRKETHNGWIYFVMGGLGCACLITVILLITIGYRDLILGIEGIFSDPAYGSSLLDTLWDKFEYAFNYLFVILSEQNKALIKVYVLILFLAGYWQKRKPIMKLLVIFYPLVVYFQIYLMKNYSTNTSGTFVFYLSVIAPFLLFFIDNHKEKFLKLLYYIFLPNVILYIIIAISSYGAAGQAAQSLVSGAMVSLIGIVYIIDETFYFFKGQKYFIILSTECKKNIMCFFLFSTLCLELNIYYSIVYRDEAVKELNSKITNGPYQGLYTTEDKKEYIEQMGNLMKELQNETESACILYHSNFAYLMLDSIPATPTTWGIYSHSSLNNEDVFFKYFSNKTEHIPDAIYIVDVPDEFNVDFQSEVSYGFCGTLKMFLNDNYKIVDEYVVMETGKVRKYSLATDKTSLFTNFTKYLLTYKYGDGFYGYEETMGSWCAQTGKINFINNADKTVKAKISFDVIIPNSQSNKLMIDDGESVSEYLVEANGIHVELNKVLLEGDNTISFITDAKKFEVEGDSRDLYFIINNIEIEWNNKEL